MIFVETPVKGAFVIDLEPNSDNRGFFARKFCVREFEAHGLNMFIVQANISFTSQRGTIRGFHYTVPPAVQRGLRYDDPVLNIAWPLPVSEIFERDLKFPLLANQL